MEIKGNEQKFIFSKKIEFTTDDGATEFVELREFNMEEMKQFQRAAQITTKSGEAEAEDWQAGFEKAEEFFKNCVVSSSFTYEGEPATGKQIYDILKKNSPLFTSILTEWMQPSGGESPFHLVQRSRTK